MSETRQYNVAFDAVFAVYLNHLKWGTPTDFAAAADWVPAAGDVKVSKDGGAAANITTLPTFVTDVGWRYLLTAAETTCRQIVVRIADAPAKAICDDMFVVETYGNGAAMWPDPTDTNPVWAQIGSTSQAAIASQVWDMPTAAHVTAGTFGAQDKTVLDQVNAALSRVPIPGTCQAGSTTTAAKLATSASASDGTYNGRILRIIGGTGAGQEREITGYIGATRMATVTHAFAIPLDATSRYVII